MHDRPPSEVCPECQNTFPLTVDGKIPYHRRVIDPGALWFLDDIPAAATELCPGTDIWPTLP